MRNQGKNTRKLNGWRPISLINVDTKILSKILVNRMKKSLSKLIHLDQYAFVSEGYIGESVRLISDVLDYTTEKKIPDSGYQSLSMGTLISADRDF